MTRQRGGLGRGLSALIPGAEEGGLLEIPVAAISPNRRQPRERFEDSALASLAASIREVGVLQPVVVRKTDEGYELVAGERRLRASKLAGLATIPAIVRETDDAETLREAIIENLHREDLSPMELAAGFQELLDDLGATQEELAERLGFSRPHITNTLRLLALPAEVQAMVNDGRLQAGHARALLGLPDPESQVLLAQRTIAEQLSVRQVEDAVKSWSGAGTRTAPATRAPDPRVAEVQERLADALETRVQIQLGRRKGKIVVEFASAKDLERIVKRIVAL